PAPACEPDAVDTARARLGAPHLAARVPGAADRVRGVPARARPRRGRARRAARAARRRREPRPGGGAAVTPLHAEKPAPGPLERPLFLREVIASMPQGARVLDAGCGPGSWPHPLRPDLDITAFDIKFPPGPPRRGRLMHVFRGDLARLPLRS